MSSEVSTTKIPLPSRHSFSPKEVANLRESFRKVDSNADGDIDIRELSQVMIMIGENHDKESLQKFMLSADGNGDGKMTFDEFLSLAEYWKARKSRSTIVSAMNSIAKRNSVPSKYATINSARLTLLSYDGNVDFKNHKELKVQKEEKEELAILLAVRLSWVVNITLLIMKVYCYVVSNSKAILASMADSIVDLVSQIILVIGEYLVNTPSPAFPAGREKVEALSVLACAVVMIVACIEVIQDASITLYEGLIGHLPELPKNYLVYIILGIGVGMKLGLFFYCRIANRGADGRQKSDMLNALAEDHLNDVFSNLAALAALAVAQNESTVWWVDSVGCIVISYIICHRWFGIMKDQSEKIVGASAPEAFLTFLRDLIRQHNPLILDADRVIAFYSGSRYNVEAFLVLRQTATVDVAYDLALSVQNMLEDLEDVQRANVHVDYMKRERLEHVADRVLARSELIKKKKQADESSAISMNLLP